MIKPLQKLLDKGADVNAAITETFTSEGELVPEGVTALMAALSKQHSNIAEMLIRHGADVNLKTVNGSTALMIAAGNDDPAIVGMLIEKGADVNAATTKTFEYQNDTIYSGATALMGAVYRKRGDIAKILIQHGADVNATSEVGGTPLMIAAGNGDAELTAALLAKGADPNAGLTEDIVVKGMPVFQGANAMLAAADGGNAECLRLMARYGGDLNSCDKNGSLPLIAAAAKGHLDAVKFLVEHGADVNGKTTARFMLGKDMVPKGSSVLTAAAFGGHTAVVKYLLAHGADVNIHDDEFDVDALFLAAMKGHFSTWSRFSWRMARMYFT